MSLVTVHYERKFSDGNYGSEGLSMSWTVDYDDSGNDLAADPAVVNGRCEVIANALRTAVLGQLARCGANNVAWAAKQELNPPPPPPPPPLRSTPTPVAASANSADMEDLPF